jgi:two-component system cell cycle response regulator
MCVGVQALTALRLHRVENMCLSKNYIRLVGLGNAWNKVDSSFSEYAELKGEIMNKAKILIVDDDQFTHESLVAILGESEYDFISAYSASQAFSVLEHNDFDMIILDVIMPGMKGFEFCRHIRMSPAYADLPVLILTSMRDQVSLLEGLSAGADDFLTKPLDPLELQVRIRTTMRLNRYRRLLEERSRFEWVIEQSCQGYFVLDAKGLILNSNKSARTMLGLDEHGAIGIDFLEAARAEHATVPPDAWWDWDTIEASKDVARYLLRSETDQSRTSWVEARFHTLNRTDSGLLLVCLSEVTDEIEERCSRWSFHSMVSHKLRTPMSAITACAQFMEYSAPEEWGQNLSPISEAFIEEVQRLDEQISKILDYTEAPKLLSTDSRITGDDIHGIVRSTAADLGLADALSIRGVETVSKMMVPFSLPAMSAIVAELLGNAKKFHPTGKPFIRCAFSSVSPDTLRMHLSNDGQILERHQLANVFTPYFQGEKFHTGQLPGMGLGLSMVALLVWRIGGKCCMCNNADDSGVTVELIFPSS